MVGVIPSPQPTARSIVFTAHYDAYGVTTVEAGGDSIHNGARDNATGVAALMELARAFRHGDPVGLNLVFVATAAEELGEHGSWFYLNNPVFPIDSIVFELNIDGFNISGPRGDYFVMPCQGVNFVDDIEKASVALGWTYRSPDWVDRMNTSFDTAPFLSMGIPAVTIWTGDLAKDGTPVESPRFGRIHTPEDEVTDEWKWDGVEDHLALYEAVARHFAARPEGARVTDPTLFAD